MIDFISLNPYTGEKHGKYQSISDENLTVEIELSKKSYYDKWKRMNVGERAAFIAPVSKYIMENKVEFATLITAEMGKPFKESIAEIEKVCWLIDYHCDNAEYFLKSVPIETENTEVYIEYSPLGGILGIMPWNFPFWQVFRFAIPTLLAGNTILLKHAPNVPRCSLKIEEIFHRFLPDKNIYKNIFIDNSQVEFLLSNNFIQGVSLTGSERAGSSVASIAGKHLKKCVLELGGNDAFVIFEDSDIEKALDQFVVSRFLNNGQVCIAAKRLVVENKILERVKDGLLTRLKKINFGDPFDENTNLTCLAREDLSANLKSQFDFLIQENSRLVFEGVSNDKCSGFPALIEVIDKNSFDFDEELFGPLALLFTFENTNDLIQLVNGSKYGLSASIWLNDIDKAKIISRDIETGFVSINKMVASDPRIPFGGIKKSGFGKEMAELGIKEFTNAKSIVIC
ncbi:MAG: aldehyde dehydrogenase family protein [Saprospiraceae bacterium]